MSTPALILAAQTEIKATEGGKTSDVFTTDGDSPFGWVNGDISRCLRPSYKATAGGAAYGHDMTKAMRFTEMADVVGGKDEVRANHLYTPLEIGQLVATQASGKEGTLLNNGYANFFFVEGQPKNDGDESPLFVVDVGLNAFGRYWSVAVCPFGDGFRWGAVFRVFLRTPLGS